MDGENLGTMATAAIRGLYSALVVAGGTLFAVAGATGGDWNAALIAAGASGFGVLATRAGVEGYIDARRAKAAGG